MRIDFVEIQNFRKLKACHIGIAEKETIFVGANNSGKTSAIDALILFLKKGRRKSFATTDFTLSNWSFLEEISQQWISASDDDLPDLAVDALLPLLPTVDVWLKADDKDLHRLSHLVPTLDWTPKELLGVRLVFAPKNIEQLYKDYRSSYMSSRDVENPSKKTDSPLLLWPSSLREYLDRTLHSQFEVQFFILDPAQRQDPVNGIAVPQLLPSGSDPLKLDPFDGLIKIDVITAQRGFSDPKTEDDTHSGFASLSSQLRRYFSKHLNPSEAPESSDIEALEAIEAAKTVFNEKLKNSFKPAVEELEGLSYPGFSDPRISISSKIDPRDALDHESAVQFDLPGASSLSLPERYNGLGYQNLISMVFNLIRFRDEWMRVGKAARVEDNKDTPIEPLQLVLIEEPEAHLHVQVQQVFIKKAYNVLRNHFALEDSAFRTQLIVSTHSTHIAHEMNFSCLRYFRREPAKEKGEIPTSTVISLSQTFGDHDKTSKFASRYLRTTHCDLFFADAVILVEGAAERILMPHFIRTRFSQLDQCYISLLEIGGAHAHRLKPLLDTLGLLSLVVTDLDSIGKTSSGKVLPKRGYGYRTGNTTLTDWVPKLESLDELLDISDGAKQTENGLVRVAYQCPIMLEYTVGKDKAEVIPYTFEDSLAFTNLEMFREVEDAGGLLKKLQAALKRTSLEDANKEMFENLGKGSKAELALELLYLKEPNTLEPPRYIADGLKWLKEKIEARKVDVILNKPIEANDA